MNFLDTVLFVHEKPKIQKFLFTVGESFGETRVNRWFRTVIKRKVEELVISITPEKPFIFPLSFFTCDSLVVLDLEYDGILNLPNTISFPRIKILRLTYIDFVNENLTGELFSNCPILEELSLSDCDFPNFKVLCITSPTLKHLSITNCTLLHQTLKVFAPNLLTIFEADIQISNDQDLERKYAPLIKLYQKLSNVKLLKASGSSFRGACSNDLQLQEYDWTVNSLPQYSLPNLKLDVVKFFLANAGVLQTMTIMISKWLSKDYKKQTQIASELLKFPRYSASCALEFMTPD
ncbi:hypothetical protein MKW92_006267 [Papaver armeniacum]|nr:hypothetical protein MKW92_006267 [Papaver armeniacum]